MLKKKLFGLLVISSLFASSDEEALFWAEVKDSNSIELLEAYNQRYPNGVFKIFADMKLNKLQGSQNSTIGSRVLLTTGTYRCNNLIIKLEDKYKATYTTNGQTYKGIWSGTGNSIITRFNIDYEYIKFKIQSDYQRYNIYKIPNTNIAYCSAVKD